MAGGRPWALNSPSIPYQSSDQPDEASGRSARGLLGAERPSAHVLALVEADEPAEPDLVGAVDLLRVHRVARRGVVDLEQDETRLEAGDVEREHAGRPEGVGVARRHERIPDGRCPLGGDPQLVAEVARVAGPRDVDGDGAPALADLRGPSAEVAQVGEGLAGRHLEHRSRARPLERESGQRLRDVLDVDVEAGRVLAEPAVLRVGGGPAELALGDPVDRAVVDDLAVLVAPRRVVDLADGHPRGVARDHPVDERVGARTGQAVLVERADVDERGRLADRVVLDVVDVGVDGRGEVARPLPPLLLAVEGRGAGVERGADAQRAISSEGPENPPSMHGSHAGRMGRRRARRSSADLVSRRRGPVRPVPRSRAGCGSRQSPRATTPRRR